MELLDLPAELFKLLIHTLVRDVGVATAFKYRLTCRTFALEIYEDVMKRQDLVRVFGGFEDSIDRDRFFVHYGSTILLNRFSSPLLGIAIFIRQLVAALLKHENSGSEALQQQYTQGVCDAFSGLISCPMSITDQIEVSNIGIFETYVPKALPAAAAAVGNVDLLQTLVTYPYEMFVGFRDIFPSPLKAAVANNQKETMEFILEYTKNEKARRPKEYALRVAVRNHRNEIRATILDSLSTEHVPEDYRFDPEFDSIRVIRECFVYDNHDLLLRLLELRSMRKGAYDIPLRQHGLTMAQKEAEYLFAKGSRSGLIKMFETHFPDPTMSTLGHRLPLDIALNHHRYDLARAILDHGADINQKSHSSFEETALELAIKRKNVPAVQYLIENGADISLIDLESNITVHEPFEEILSLCQLASEHAQGRKLTHDEWYLFWKSHCRGDLAREWHWYEKIKVREL